MIVGVKDQSIDFSEASLGELDVDVLLRLREALENNDHFSRLVLSNNRLTGDAIKVLGATLKGTTFIRFLHMSACNLSDKDVLPITSALCMRKTLQLLDLSKNPEITSESAPELAKVIAAVTSLETLLLGGTGLRSAKCAHIITAVQQNPSIRVLELPYTVGFKVLDSVRRLIDKKSEDTSEKASDGKENVKDKSLFMRKITAAALEAVTDPWETRALPKLVLPSVNISGDGAQKIDEGLRRANDTSWTLRFSHLSDPAVKKAAVHLHELDRRCRLFETHQQEKQERLSAKRGLGEKNRFFGFRSRHHNA